MMTYIAWIWLCVGAVLMLLEIAVPGFVLFFFGLSAATVGVFRFIFGGALTLTWQLAVFSLFSVLYLLFLRRWCKKLLSGTSEVSGANFDHESVGRVGKITEPINPPLSGRVLIGDAEWTAIADSPIPAGTDVTVVSQSNLTMKVVSAN